MSFQINKYQSLLYLLNISQNGDDRLKHTNYLPNILPNNIWRTTKVYSNKKGSTTNSHYEQKSYKYVNIYGETLSACNVNPCPAIKLFYFYFFLIAIKILISDCTNFKP